jgi:hypothetical protein
MMEAVSTSETSACFYETILRYIPEARHCLDAEVKSHHENMPGSQFQTGIRIRHPRNMKQERYPLHPIVKCTLEGLFVAYLTCRTEV